MSLCLCVSVVKTDVMITATQHQLTSLGHVIDRTPQALGRLKSLSTGQKV
jgi:hypothetical protein